MATQKELQLKANQAIKVVKDRYNTIKELHFSGGEVMKADLIIEHKNKKTKSRRKY